MGSMKYTIYSADSFRMLITVERSSGGVLPLAGATIEAVAASGKRRAAASIDMIDAEVGRFGLIFGKGALAVGMWQLQLSRSLK
ncbi:hypothetical protein [Rhodobacter maris]|uniref:Uncharacterized protein n=1 Tax=Rhodobacter maris TaxID=446682 RepID=A0A285TGP4_9RHOB|nr:hypothetical protein [Rhodobacter maris]SOC19498.1 hypothetical protein SAMN05877831_1181 [Rhodobacter maris]